MRPPSKQPPASLWDGMHSGEEQWVVRIPGVPKSARYIRDISDPQKAKVTLYRESPHNLWVQSVAVASIAVPYDSSLTVAQRQELANAMLSLYVLTYCPSSE